MKILNKDKIYHFIGGIGVALLFSSITITIGLLAGLSAAVLKEIYDYFNPNNNTVDGIDFISTTVGVLAAIEVLRCFGLQ